MQDEIAATVQHAIGKSRRKSSFTFGRCATSSSSGSFAAISSVTNVLQRYGQMGKISTIKLGRVRDEKEKGKGGDFTV